MSGYSNKDVEESANRVFNTEEGWQPAEIVCWAARQYIMLSSGAIVPMPQSKLHAEAMCLIGEKYLKDNP